MNDNNVHNATLIAHCGTHKVSREDLKKLPVPESTRTHQPLSHFQIVETLEEALSFRYLRVVRDEYAVSPDGMRMFGVMDLSAEFNGCRFSIGLRNSNDKSMRLALTAGLRVSVCDNMMFSGDFHPLLHKHTRKLDLIDSISIAVDRIQRGFAPLQRQVGEWQETFLPDTQVKLIIYEAFLDKRLKVPKHLMSLVHHHYFEPREEEFKEKTFWSLSNAFTSAFKKLQPVQQFMATAKLGTFLTEVYQQLSEDVLDELYGSKKHSDLEKPFRPYLVSSQPVQNENLHNEFLRDFHDENPTEDSFNEKDLTDKEIQEAIEEMEVQLADEPDEFFEEASEAEEKTKDDSNEEISETLSDNLVEEIEAEKSADETKLSQTVKSTKNSKTKKKGKTKTLELAA